MNYIELHARSAFSFLEGASVPEELAAVCAEQGMAAMAVVDRDGEYGAPRFHLAMKKAGMKAHIGSEITFLPQGERVDGRWSVVDGHKAPELGGKLEPLQTGVGACC